MAELGNKREALIRLMRQDPARVLDVLITRGEEAMDGPTFTAYRQSVLSDLDLGSIPSDVPDEHVGALVSIQRQLEDHTDNADALMGALTAEAEYKET